MITTLKRGFYVSALALIVIALGAFSVSSAAASSLATKLVGPPGYHITLFARSTKTYYNPDPITVDGNHIYVAYQNHTVPDGSTHKPSTIVEYNSDGKVLQTFKVLGHCDGLRVDPATHLLWALVNNDAHPGLFIINPQTEKITAYTFPKPPHGGGYDDLAFVHGMTFISASNPTLNSKGINVFPAVDKVSLSGTKVVLKPVLYGNATALDTTTHMKVKLNLIDPDSLTHDLRGDVVLDNQAGAQIVFLHDAGTAQQTVTVVPLGTQVDDSAWASSANGHMFVVDITKNAIFTVSHHFVPGTVYTEAPSDSGVAGFVGTIDLRTGTITPLITGFASPTGLIFVQD